MLNMDFGDIQEKIFKACRENDLEFSFESSKFPVVATISPDLEKLNQMSFDFGDDKQEKTNYINGKIQFIFGEELTMNILNDFRIEDKLLNKIKNLAKNLHYIYLQIYFREKTK